MHGSCLEQHAQGCRGNLLLSAAAPFNFPFKGKMRTKESQISMIDLAERRPTARVVLPPRLEPPLLDFGSLSWCAICLRDKKDDKAGRSGDINSKLICCTQSRLKGFIINARLCCLPAPRISHITSPTSLLPPHFSHLTSPTSLLPPHFSHLTSPTSLLPPHFSHLTSRSSPFPPHFFVAASIWP
jgi:hypothetical protein